MRRARHTLDYLLRGQEVLLDLLDNRREHMLVKEYHPFDVQLGAKQVKEDILAFALVKLTDHARQLSEHWKGLRRVARARYHLAH